VYVLALHFCLASAAVSQQNPSSTSTSTQALTALQGAYSVLVGKTVVVDVTLTGTVERIAGSDDETGTATYKAIASSSRLDLSFSTGNRSEIRGSTASGPSGTWIGPDSESHPMANHNLLTDVGWFPVFTIQNLLSSSNVSLTYVGQETKDDLAVTHIRAAQEFPSSPASMASVWQHLTQVDIYLDPSTLLPVSYVYNAHPDNNALLDIPTEIRFSTYQTVAGARIPLHMQQFVNNSLTLDLQFQNPSLNTGITAAQISAQ
jgi:hypothetical protein